MWAPYICGIAFMKTKKYAGVVETPPSEGATKVPFVQEPQKVECLGRRGFSDPTTEDDASNAKYLLTNHDEHAGKVPVRIEPDVLSL